MLLEGNWMRNLLFDSPPESVQRTNARIARPTEHQLVNAACGQKLINDDVGCLLKDREMPLALSNHFVTYGEWYSMSEASKTYKLTIVYELPDRLACSHHFSRHFQD